MLLSLLPISDDFPESTGVKRIVQALNANVWSSVEMKDGEMTLTCIVAYSPKDLMSFYVCMIDHLYLSYRAQSGIWSDEQFGGLQTQQPTELPGSTS